MNAQFTRIGKILLFPAPPHAQTSNLTRMIAGNRLAGPTGRKWAEHSFSTLPDGKAKEKRGIAPLPCGERLLSLFLKKRGVPCNTPLYNYRSVIK